MASLWDTITGASRQNSSAEQMKRDAARQAAEDAAARKAAKDKAEQDAADKKVKEIVFKRGGSVAAKKVAPARKPAAKTKSRR